MLQKVKSYMAHKNNAVLVDFEPNSNWDFFKGLNENNDWEIIKCVSNGRQSKAQNIKRVLKYVFFPLKIFFKRKKFEYIVGWQQFYALFLCFYLRLFHCRKGPKVVVLTFIYKEKKGFKGKLYKKFIKYALGCKFLKKLVVLSSYEKEYYSSLFAVSIDKFAFCHIGANEEKKLIEQKGDYFVSAGRSNRDYDFLVNYFIKHQEHELYIISDRYKNKNITKNIHILDNCFNLEYEKMVANSFAVIISLYDEPISSGQLVALRAFKYKKPIIATNNSGITDYVLDNENGFIIEKQEESLDSAIKKLLDEQVYKRISNSHITFSNREYGRQIGRLFEK